MTTTMRNNKALLIALSICCFAMTTTSYAQEQQKKDVKVGLVLSGGGAKGLAHIGALKVIEEAGIRIDYIGGTSMGAIVGALYASGYSAHQLDSIFNVADFEKLIQDELPRSAKTFYEKEDAERYALTLPFDDFKISFPSALSKGQNVYNLLAQLTRHVSHIEDFNELPIPFFCVATDIEKGKPVILNKGYLAEAIVASGAFPSLFEPVDIDGTLLIDGGVTNNYPIDEVKAMGADIIIGVDVQDALLDRETLNSAPEILLQINNYRTVEAMVEKSKKTDLYIKPDITDFSVISFDQGRNIIDNGEEAARAKLRSLTGIAQQQAPSAPREKIDAITDEIFINDIKINGNDRYTRAYVRGKLRFKTPSMVSFQKLNEGISNLSATGNFKGIRYRFNNTPLGNQLALDLEEKKNTTFLRLGVHYDDLYKSAGLVNITKKRLLADNDVASLDLILGDNPRYNFEYYIDKGFYWSIGLRSRYNSFEKGVDFDLFQDAAIEAEINNINIDYEDFTNQFYLQTVLREEFAFGIGAEHKRLKISSETIVEREEEETYFEKSDFISAFGFLKLDTYDNRYFPRKGVYFDGDLHWYLHSSDFTKQFNQFALAKAKIGYATTFFDALTLRLESEGGFKIGQTELRSLDFILGGYGNNFVNNIIPFYGYDYLSFGGDSFVKGTITLDYEIFPKNHINFVANYANAADNIFDDGEWFTTPNFSGYAIGYGLETFIGPIEAKYSWSPENDDGRFFFTLGFWF